MPSDAPSMLRESDDFADKIPIIGLISTPLAVIALSGSTVASATLGINSEFAAILSSDVDCRVLWVTDRTDLTEPDQNSIPIYAKQPFFMKFDAGTIIRAVRETNASNGKLWVIKTW